MLASAIKKFRPNKCIKYIVGYINILNFKLSKYGIFVKNNKQKIKKLKVKVYLKLKGKNL
tara:strand:- start:3090 stop:3269 length:180 start_codon:yes stop_codon:yes gene_type:complete